MGVTIPKTGMANSGTVTRLNSPRDNASLGDLRKLRPIISRDLR